MRFSQELVQIHISGYQMDEDVLTDVIHALAEQEINLPFLSVDGTQGARANLCMAKSDFIKVHNVFDDLLDPLQVDVSFDSAGTLALFPHQSRFTITSLALAVLAENKLPVYGMSSSISALSLNTDYHHLDRAAELLQSVFQLPAHHTPFRQHLKESIAGREKGTCHKRPYVETAASYWEPVIKIYGSSIKTNLELATVKISQAELANLKTQCMISENTDDFFELVVAHPLSGGGLQLVVLYGRDRSKAVHRLLSGVSKHRDDSLAKHCPVELLYFHGPHFQDRFGVADAMFGALKKHQINTLAAGCTGTSIYLVIHDKMAKPTAEILSDIFHVPNLIA